MRLNETNLFRGYPTGQQGVECTIGLQAAAIKEDVVWGERGGEERD